MRWRRNSRRGFGVRANSAKFELVDYQKQNRETALTRSIARKLKVKVISQRRGPQSAKQGTREATRLRVKGGIELHGDRLELQVTVYLGDQEVNAVEEHIALASRAEVAGSNRPAMPVRVATEKKAIPLWRPRTAGKPRSATCTSRA